MPLLVKDLFQLQSLKNAKLISGSRGLDNEISNIMVMEAPDIERWMVPGQLLLTSLFGLQNYSTEQIADFIQRVSQYKCSCIVVKKDRFVSEIPSAMVAACERHALPLLQISINEYYRDILAEVMQLLFNEKVRLLNNYHTVHIQFTQLAMSQPSFLQMIQLLEQLIDNPVALLNNQQELVCATHPCMEAPTLLEKEPLQQQDYMTYSYEKHLAVLNPKSAEKSSLITAKIPNIGNDFYYLLVAQKRKPIEAMDFMAIENAISFLQMELIKKFAISEVQQNYMNDLIDDLMSGKIASKEKMRDALEYLKLSPQEEYRVVVIQLSPKQVKWDETESKKHMQRFVDKFRFYWNKSLYRIRSDRVVLILPTPGLNTAAFKKKTTDTVCLVLRDFPADTFRYRIGIGESCNVNDLQKYSVRVLKAVHLAGSIQPDSFIICCEDLGLYGFLADISEEEQLMKLIPSQLKGLHQENPVLTQTFQTFLDNNQNLKNSAEILYVHPKTMRYRLNRIQDITGVNFNDPEEILQYNIGFRVMRMLNLMSAQEA